MRTKFPTAMSVLEWVVAEAEKAEGHADEFESAVYPAVATAYRRMEQVVMAYIEQASPEPVDKERVEVEGEDPRGQVLDVTVGDPDAPEGTLPGEAGRFHFGEDEVTVKPVNREA